MLHKAQVLAHEKALNRGGMLKYKNSILNLHYNLSFWLGVNLFTLPIYPKKIG